MKFEIIQTGSLKKDSGITENLIIPVKIISDSPEANLFLAPVSHIYSHRGAYWELASINEMLSANRGVDKMEMFDSQITFFGQSIYVKSFQALSSSFNQESAEKQIIHL